MHRPDLPLLDRMKVQAEVLVPLVRELEAALGREEAHALVRRALAPRARAIASMLTERLGGPRPAVDRLYAVSKADGAGFEDRTLRWDDEHIDLDVTRCHYAEFYASIGAADLGPLLACSQDFDQFAVLDGIDLHRTQTIMEGASHCDFRITLRPQRDGQAPDADERGAPTT